MAAQPPSECIGMLCVRLAKGTKFQVSFRNNPPPRKTTLASGDDFESDDTLNMDSDRDVGGSFDVEGDCGDGRWFQSSEARAFGAGTSMQVMPTSHK